MNAWTGMDFTMYPFASQNSNDFENLMRVYLDFSFFPKLNYMDFKQEGYRIEYENPTDKDSALQYKGVVYNEMKGAMSNPGEKYVYTLNE
jgi:Zn-dependent M16 (insulinase) family peptidase